MKNTTTTLLLTIGILILINVLSEKYFFRVDLTEDKQYTLSKATRDILEELADQGETVTVTAYFSENLPSDIAKVKTDFQDLLTEYHHLSKGYLDFNFIAPETEEEKQDALQQGIQPVMINVREKDQMKAQQAFLGAVLKLNEQTEIVPLIQPGMAMEYALSTNVKKMAVADKPSVALLAGHGEPSLEELAQVYEELSILYQVESIDLRQMDSIPARIKTAAILNPTDTFMESDFLKLEAFLNAGGNLLIALNAVDGDLQNQSGSARTTGLEIWLRQKGVEVEQAFVLDAQCGTVSITQQQGFFTMQTPVQFPYLPIVSQFAEHPISAGLEQILFPFISPVRFLGKEGLRFTPLLFSSSKAGISQTPVYFDVVGKQWTAMDFPLKDVVLGGVLEPDQEGLGQGKMVIFGDGDFCISGQRGQAKDNISLLVNGMDWLSDDTGLIELRTKGVASRPIDPLDDATRNSLKYLNFLLPLFLVVLYGVFRFQRQRRLRQIRQLESWI